MLRLTILLLSLSALALCRNPGYKIRVTKAGLQYASEAGGKVISKIVKKVVLPPFSFSATSLNLNIKDIKVTKFDNEKWTIVQQPPSTIAIRLDGATLAAAGDYTGKVVLSNVKGDLSVSASGTDLAVAASLGVDANGRPTVTETSCSASMADFDIHMHGDSMSNFLNLFHKLIANIIKPKLITALCQEVGSAVNTNLAKVLASLPTAIPLGNSSIGVDYRLLAPPSVTADYVEVEGRGEIDVNGKNNDPFDAAPLDTSGSGDTLMAYFWGSEYILDSAMYALQQSGTLGLLVDKDNAPSAKALLATTCAALCVGTIVKEIGTDFPNTYTAIFLNSSSIPKIAISSSGIILTATATIDMKVLVNGTYENIAGADMNITADVNAALSGNNITGKVAITQLDIAGTYDDLSGPVNWLFLSKLAQNILQNEINALLKKGIPLPVIDGVSFVSPYLAMKDKTLEVATNIQYTPTF